MSDLFSEYNQRVKTKTKKKQSKQTSQDLGFLSPDLKAKDLASQVDWVLTHRDQKSIPNLIELSSHKSVLVRRKIAITLGILGGKEILDSLRRWQTTESDRQTWLVIESSIDKISRRKDGVLEKHTQTTILSVSEALTEIKRNIGQNEYWIEGELADIKPVQQMYYFAIKDNQDTRIDCRAFVGKIIKAGFPLNEGLTVRIRGKFAINKYSRLNFSIEEIELTGEGELLRNLQELEKKLTAEGIFDTSRKRKIPKYPKKILLLASKSSAAIDDFQRVLSSRIGGVDIYLLPIKTQGVGAEYEIIESLKMANLLADKYQIETVVLTRGGGSKDDLFVFNSEKVVRAIHALNRPSIVAIGHERDTTLAELAADLRAATPSQAAEKVSVSRSETKAQLEAINHFLASYFETRKQKYQLATDQLLAISLATVQKQIHEYKLEIHRYNTLQSNIFSEVRLETNQILASIQKILQQQIYTYKSRVFEPSLYQQSLRNNILARKEKVISLQRNSLQLFKQKFFNLKQKSQNLETQIKLLDPQNILDRGFAIVYQNQTVVETKKEFQKSLETEIQFADGKLKIKPKLGK